jgi:hypothetical protein
MTDPGGFSFPGAGSYDSQKGFDFTVEKYGQNGLGKRVANVQEFKSNYAQISFKRLLANSLEPTNVMEWRQRPPGPGPSATMQVHSRDSSDDTGTQETLIS